MSRESLDISMDIYWVVLFGIQQASNNLHDVVGLLRISYKLEELWSTCLIIIQQKISRSDTLGPCFAEHAVETIYVVSIVSTKDLHFLQNKD